MRYGATGEEWAHFDVFLGLTADLLPVVSNPGAKISPNSAIKKIGKTPSRYNSDKQVTGISQWTVKKATSTEVDNWSSVPDYGICLQTRKIRAIDIDVTDAALAARIRNFIQSRFKMPERVRNNSSKCLLAFECEGEIPKRMFKTSNGIVEFLGTGQQFIAAGQHESGARYEWDGGLPDFPVVALSDVDALWQQLVNKFAESLSVESKPSGRLEKLNNALISDKVARLLLEKGLVKSQERDGRLHIVCPFESEHSTESADSATTYFPMNTGGYSQGHFHCLHAHCAGRHDGEYKSAIGYIEDEFADLTLEVEELKQSPEKPAFRFPVLKLSEFCNVPPPEWFIKNILPRGEIGMIYGASASGKTFFTMDLICALARGVNWRGYHVPRKLKVVYVATEGIDSCRSRFLAYASHHGLDSIDDIGVHVIEVLPNLMIKEDSEDIAKAILYEIGGADIIVVDTFAKATLGSDENSGKDIGAAFKNCGYLNRTTGAMVILVHHSGKDASRGARGHSSLLGNLDFQMQVIREGDQRAAIITKAKDGEDGTEFPFRLQKVVSRLDSDGEPILSCVVVSSDKMPARRKIGVIEQLIIDTLNAELSGEIARENLISECVASLEAPEGRDTRRQHVTRSLQKLLDSSDIILNNGMIKAA